MRRLLTTSLLLSASAFLPRASSAQSPFGAAEQSHVGAREIGIFATGRILSTEYSVEDHKTAFGGALTFGSHLKSILAIQGGLAVNYGKQELTYYKPPLVTITPTISLILQRSTAADFQPYALIGAGYEFVRFTRPRCDCDQSKSLGVANLGVGMRKMLGTSRALRAEISTQVGPGGPAFTGMGGMSFFVGSRRGSPTRLRPPKRVRIDPPLIPVPKTSTTVVPSRTTAPPAAPATVLAPAPANNVLRTPRPSALPTGVGAVLLQIDGTQVDFTRPTWRDDAESLLDGLVVDLTSDAGQRIKVSIEAHTDNIGSNAGNIMLGLDRARAVREYLVSQGLSADRVRVSSAGEDAPKAPNTTAIGRQQNRRIIIKRDN